jgi:hypothetical protein
LFCSFRIIARKKALTLPKFGYLFQLEDGRLCQAALLNLGGEFMAAGYQEFISGGGFVITMYRCTA